VSLFLISHRLRLSPLGTAATTGLLFRPQMTDDDDCGTVGGMRIDRGNRGTRRKLAPTATLSTTNPTWTDPGSNLGLRGGKQVTNCLSYGTASTCPWKLYVLQLIRRRYVIRKEWSEWMRFSCRSQPRFLIPSVQNYKLLQSLLSVVAITLKTRFIFPSGGLSWEQE
jgi:hypothetical protein